MKPMTTLRCVRNTLLALVLAATSGLAAAATIHVSLNTAGFASPSGWLDLQFNPAPGSSYAVTSALVHNFSGFDPLGAAELNGDVSGTLATGYQFGNASAWNDVLQAASFGGVLGFDVTFSGAMDLDAFLSQSVFTIAAFAEDKFTPLGNYDANGSLANLSWVPVNSNGGSGVDIGINDPGAVTAVPEPSDWLLSGTGLALMALVLRRRRATAGLPRQGMALAA